jgi:hypothetical protein
MSEQPRRVDATAEDEHTWTQNIEIAGSELVDRTKELIAEDNVRRLIIRTSDDEKLLEVPLTTGLAVGGGSRCLLRFWPRWGRRRRCSPDQGRRRADRAQTRESAKHAGAMNYGPRRCPDSDTAFLA